MPKPLAVVPELEAELDSLYAHSPEEFTAARNDLARRLKQAGQEGAAAKVKQLRKPTVPLWAVNQLARSHPDELRTLLDAADRLRTAQQDALRGAESGELRKATADEREALRKLTQRGEALARAASRAIAPERIAATLRAAAVDPAARELLAQGRLSEELEASGFGALAGMEVAATPAARRKRAPSAAAQRRREERLRKLQDEVAKTAREVAKASKSVARAETALGEAREQLAASEAAARDAESALAAADGEDAATRR